MKTNNDGQQLIITNVNSKDEGKYYCVAKTETGMNSGEIELFVTKEDNNNMTSIKQTLKNEIMMVKPAIIGIACIAFLVSVMVIMFVRRKYWNNSHSSLPQYDNTSQTLKSSHYTANFY